MLAWIGNTLDRFESFILNYARRVISFVILLATVIGVLSFLISTVNFLDSPNKTIADTFDVPEFTEPTVIQPEPEKKTEDKTVDDSTVNTTTEWQHPMPEYEDEISDIVQDIWPIYMTFIRFENTDIAKQEHIGFIFSQLKGYAEGLSSKQMDDMVDGLEEYIDDFSSYYRKEFDITRNLDKIKFMKNEKMNLILANPYRPYIDAYYENYLKHQGEAEIAQEESAANNASAYSTIIITAGAIGLAVILILMLLLFKAENSLRRQAEALEKE